MHMDERTRRIWNRFAPQQRAAFFSCLITGLLVHLYAFTYLIPNADGLSRVFDLQQMTVSGRWFLHYASALNNFTQMPAVIGLLSLLWITAPRWLSAGVYLCMGWLVVFALNPLASALPLEGMLWLVAGGVFYSVGGVLYALKWPGRNHPRFGCHEIFHVFILLGSVCHYINMYRVILYL